MFGVFPRLEVADGFAAAPAAQTLPDRQIDVVRKESDAAVGHAALHAADVITSRRGEQAGVGAARYARHIFRQVASASRKFEDDRWERVRVSAEHVDGAGVGYCEQGSVDDRE